MTTSHTDERSQAYARKWQDMTPFNRYVSYRWPWDVKLISRFAEPKEIGDLAVLMCSERNTPWMTGSDVVIDGGKFFKVKCGLELISRLHNILDCSYNGILHADDMKTMI